MLVLLVSTYDLGRQPLGLAAPAARLRAAGVGVTCVDAARRTLADDDIAGADVVAFYLPMHTATRLAAPLIARVRAVNPRATLAAYGLYAPLNAAWLRASGVAHVIGPEEEAALVSIAHGAARAGGREDGPRLDVPAPWTAPSPGARSAAVSPDRTGLPPLAEYAQLQMPDGSTRVAGSTDATRGCKHTCRHCPIVPVYGGRFRAVPVDVVLQDVRAQVEAGARHVTFGDPDFLNGPAHARRLVERLHAELPSVTYDVTIKIAHLLAHADLLPLLRDTGCLFVTSAVESVDDRVLEKLQKGHTRADVFRAAGLCRAAGVTLTPTFVPFTPWTTGEGYLDLLGVVDALELVEHVAPIQFAIRLLVTAGSRLLELDDVRAAVGPFERQSLTWPWVHADPSVDALQQEVMALVSARACCSRSDVFDAILALTRSRAGEPPLPRTPARTPAPVPRMTEAWYCCAEPWGAG